MRALLDTHAILWWFNADAALSPAAHSVMAEVSNSLVVSAASVWEISTKFRLGKLPGAADLIANFRASVEMERFEFLDMTPDHALRAGLLPGPHRDPFDRMLVAQAQAENLPIIGSDRVFDLYGIRRIW